MNEMICRTEFGQSPTVRSALANRVWAVLHKISAITFPDGAQSEKFLGKGLANLIWNHEISPSTSSESTLWEREWRLSIAHLS
jgi:hypothetical protein